MKYPRAQALQVARELVAELKPVTERLIIAGSLRRKCQAVGDVEILFIPKIGTRPCLQGDLFSGRSETYSITDAVLDEMIEAGTLAYRPNSAGFRIWGAKNKLATHARSGIPVDLFAATEENWYNYLVCRTGPAASNIRIAEAAKRMDGRWHPYAEGFTFGEADTLTRVKCESEEAVFAAVGLPYRPPHQR